MLNKKIIGPLVQCMFCSDWYDPDLKSHPCQKNKYAIYLGSLGGLATAKAMTPEQRRERAKKAVEAREKKRKKG